MVLGAAILGWLRGVEGGVLGFVTGESYSPGC